jgi:hypothetical protein
MKRVARITGAVLVSCCWGGAFAQTGEVPPDFWDRPRTAGALLSNESVKSMVSAALAQPDAQLVIHHGRGQEPQIQAEELRSWLGALAIDTRRIVLRNDLGAGASIKMELVP